MPSTTCGHCKTYTHMTYLESVVRDKTIHHLLHPVYVFTIDGAYTCDACHRVSVMVAVVKDYPGEDPRSIDAAVEQAMNVRWFPQVVNRPEYEDVDAKIASAAGEAHACASIGARAAAIIMARSVLESCAKLMEAEGRDLYAKVEWLRDSGLLLPGIVAAAHEVRFFGNDMAHGDFVESITEEDVAEVLGIMDDLIDALFTQPARTRRRTEARASRRAAAGSTESIEGQ